MAKAVPCPVNGQRSRKEMGKERWSDKVIKRPHGGVNIDSALYEKSVCVCIYIKNTQTINGKQKCITATAILYAGSI